MTVADISPQDMFQVRSAAYRPPMGYRPTFLQQGLPPFTLQTVEWMKRDCQIKLGMSIKTAPYQRTKCTLKGDPEVVEYMGNQIRRVWMRALPKIQYALWYTTCCGEIGYRINDQHGYPEFWSFTDFYPTDCSILSRRGIPIGISVKDCSWSGGISSQQVGTSSADNAINMQKQYLYFPKGFLYIHKREFNSLYGQSEFEASYDPWLEKNDWQGAKHARKLWFFKNAFNGGILFHPPGSYRTESGDLIPYESIARQAIETASNGAVWTFESKFDEKNNPEWNLVEPKVNPGGAELVGYVNQLDIEMLRGLGIPDDVIQQATGNGGSAGSFSGRTIPLMAFFISQEAALDNMFNVIDEQILRPLCKTRFGHDHYEASMDVDIDRLMGVMNAGEVGDAGQANSSEDDNDQMKAAGKQLEPQAKQMSTGNVQVDNVNSALTDSYNDAPPQCRVITKTIGMRGTVYLTGKNFDAVQMSDSAPTLSRPKVHPLIHHFTKHIRSVIRKEVEYQKQRVRRIRGTNEYGQKVPKQMSHDVSNEPRDEEGKWTVEWTAEKFKATAQKHSDALKKYEVFSGAYIKLQNKSITIKEALNLVGEYVEGENAKTKKHIQELVDSAKAELSDATEEMSKANAWAKSIPKQMSTEDIQMSHDRVQSGATHTNKSGKVSKGGQFTDGDGTNAASSMGSMVRATLKKPVKKTSKKKPTSEKKPESKTKEKSEKKPEKESEHPRGKDGKWVKSITADDVGKLLEDQHNHKIARQTVVDEINENKSLTKKEIQQRIKESTHYRHEKEFLQDRFVKSKTFHLMDIPIDSVFPLGKVQEGAESHSDGPIIVDINPGGMGRLHSAFGAPPDHIILDGKHRHAAALAKGQKTIKAYVGDKAVDSLKTKQMSADDVEQMSHERVQGGATHTNKSGKVSKGGQFTDGKGTINAGSMADMVKKTLESNKKSKKSAPKKKEAEPKKPEKKIREEKSKEEKPKEEKETPKEKKSSASSSMTRPAKREESDVPKSTEKKPGDVANKLFHDHVEVAPVDMHKIERYKKAWNNVFEQMPDAVKECLDKNLGSCEFFPSVRDLTHACHRRHPQFRRVSSIAGWASAPLEGVRKGSLHLDGDGSDCTTEAIYAHEIGHVIDPFSQTKDDPVLKRISHRKEWQTAWKEELENDSLTVYAASSAQEGFAEFARAVLWDSKGKDGRAALRRQFPKCYKVFEDIGYTHKDD